jgi:tetratricopeptide (TPR) repeat protein
VELSNRGRFQEAGAKFVAAIAADPKFAEAHYLLGLVRQQDGRLDAALRSYREAIASRPGYPEAQARICELGMRASRNTDKGYAEARPACKKAIALGPRDPDPHFYLGWLEAKLGNYAGAIAEYSTALQLDGRYPNARFELAMAYLDSGQQRKAVALLQQVVQAEPRNGVASFQLGAALAKTGQCAEAMPLLDSAVESPQRRYIRAGCYKKLGRDAEAAADLQAYKELREGADARMQAKYRAAVAHQKAAAGELDAAIAEYRGALALAPDVGIRVDLAVALLKKGSAAEVLTLLENDREPVARYQVALAQAKLGNAKAALSELEGIIAARPEFAEAWFQAGAFLLAEGDVAQGSALLERAVSLRPDEAEFRLALAAALDRLGKKREAAEQRAVARGAK